MALALGFLTCPATSIIFQLFLSSFLSLSVRPTGMQLQTEPIQEAMTQTHALRHVLILTHSAWCLEMKGLEMQFVSDSYQLHLPPGEYHC